MLNWRSHSNLCTSHFFSKQLWGGERCYHFFFQNTYTKVITWGRGGPGCLRISRKSLPFFCLTKVHPGDLLTKKLLAITLLCNTWYARSIRWCEPETRKFEPLSCIESISPWMSGKKLSHYYIISINQFTSLALFGRPILSHPNMIIVFPQDVAVEYAS